MSSQQWRPYQVLKTQLIQFLGGDELVVVVRSSGGGLLQLLCQAVQEGGPSRSRAKGGNERPVKVSPMTISNQKHSPAS